MKKKKGQKIGEYVVTFPLKKTEIIQSYRVKNDLGENYFAKCINLSKLDEVYFDQAKNVLEETILRSVRHTNLATYKDSFSEIMGIDKFKVLVMDFIPGVTLNQHLANNRFISVFEATRIVLAILEGVEFLHSQSNPILHNNLDLESVMLDLTTIPSTPKIIDFHNADFEKRKDRLLDKLGDNLFYRAPEIFKGEISTQSDLYSVGAILYHLIFGVPPHFMALSSTKVDTNELIKNITEQLNQELCIPERNLLGLNNLLIQVIKKSLASNPDERYKTAKEMASDLTMAINLSQEIDSNTSSSLESKSLFSSAGSCMKDQKVDGGFSEVAGMDDLKEDLRSDVIDVLRDPKRAKELGLSLPNGLFFYGPPGCGKTFFAEKFAEEVGCNYLYVKCSDVASPYIHGGQGKIAEIFNNARKKAPSILFFDEIDAMILDRSKHTNASESGEVNEFLTQLNNCGKHGVIVIGATNKPDQVDQAALRAGRLEYKYYIPPPDAKTRLAIFKINLKHRKTEMGIEYQKLAELTDGFISSDIKLIVDKAARLVFKRKESAISQEILEEVIRTSQPSLSAESLSEYERIRERFENQTVQKKRRPIGFLS